MNYKTLIYLTALFHTVVPDQLVPDLTTDMFHNVTARKEGATLVMFYTPWCPHCQDAKPHFLNAAKKMAETNKSNKFALVNCDDAKNTDLCTTQKIEGYPTIKLFAPKNETHIFSSESTEDNFIKFFADPAAMAETGAGDEETPDVALKYTPYLNAGSFKSMLAKTAHALVFFYAPWCPHCQEAKPAIDEGTKKLSSKDRVIFAVNCEEKDNKKLCEDEKVEGFPTIRYYHQGEMYAEYDDRMEANSFLKYLSKPPKEKIPLAAPQPDSTEEENADEEKMKHVRYTTGEDFSDLINERKTHVMVMFYVPMCSHCKDAKPEFDAAAQEIQKKNTERVLAAVNCADKQNEELCRKEKISGFPTFMHYHKGKRVEEFTDVPLSKDKLVVYFSSKVKDEL